MENQEAQIKLIIEDIRSGRDHAEIKQDLLNSGIDEITAASLVKRADSMYLDDLLIGQPERKPLISRSMIGILMIVAGVLVTVFTYLEAIRDGGVYVI